MLTNFLKSDINKDSFPLKDKTHTSFWCGSYLLKNITQLEGLSKKQENCEVQLPFTADAQKLILFFCDLANCFLVEVVIEYG